MSIPTQSDLRLILTTMGREEAPVFARRLVEQRLAACVTVTGPVRSVYRWEGRIEEAEEVLILIKTTEAGARRLAEALRTLHPYEVPEWLEFRPDAAHDAYLAWVVASAGGEGGT
jgi:periplasmic divalent cation tolerance protein